MGIDDMPSMKHQRSQLRLIRWVLALNGILRRFGSGSERISNVGNEVNEGQRKMEKLIEYILKFNEHFGAHGWLFHEWMDADVMTSAVDAATDGNEELATAILMDYYSPQKVNERVQVLRHPGPLRIRRKLIDYALTEYIAGRYYSAVPLLLMTIDGAVCDAVGRGLHADGVDTDAWDSPVVASGSIERIRGIFQKGRRKTRTEPIDMPYRNGILHGMDLGYDNAVVTAKCWCYLFAVRDWLVARESEAARQEKFERETHVPSLGEVVSRVNRTERRRRAIEEWKPRSLSQHYVDQINAGEPPMGGSPEAVVVEFLDLWKRQNYGHLSALFSTELSSYATNVRLLREHYERTSVREYSIKCIRDESPAIAEVEVEIVDQSAQSSRWIVRLTRDDPSEAPGADPLGGDWRVVWTRREGTVSTA